MAQIDMAYAGKWWHKLLQIVFDPQAPSNDQMSSELGTKNHSTDWTFKPSQAWRSESTNYARKMG